MEPILVDDRLDFGQFGNLMDQGFWVVARESMSTTATGLRLAVERRADPLGRDQCAVGPTMSGLPAAFLAPGRGGRLAFQADGVGRGGLGRVGGVEFEPRLEVVELSLEGGDPLLVSLDQRRDRQLKLGRSRVPKGFRKRRRWCHDGKIVTSFANSNPRP